MSLPFPMLTAEEAADLIPHGAAICFSVTVTGVAPLADVPTAADFFCAAFGMHLSRWMAQL